MIDCRTKTKERSAKTKAKPKATKVTKASKSKQQQKQPDEDPQPSNDVLTLWSQQESQIPEAPFTQYNFRTVTTSRIPDEYIIQLVAELKDFRACTSDINKCMPYHILPDAAIFLIAKDVPISDDELLEIEGVGKARVNKFGEQITAVVKEFLSRVCSIISLKNFEY